MEVANEVNTLRSDGLVGSPLSEQHAGAHREGVASEVAATGAQRATIPSSVGWPTMGSASDSRRGRILVPANGAGNATPPTAG